MQDNFAPGDSFAHRVSFASHFIKHTLLYEFMYKKAAINSSSTRILLVDSSKFGKMRPCMFSNLSDFDVVITDSNIGGNWISLFEQSNLKYIIV